MNLMQIFSYPPTTPELSKYFFVLFVKKVYSFVTFVRVFCTQFIIFLKNILFLPYFLSKKCKLWKSGLKTIYLIHNKDTLILAFRLFFQFCIYKTINLIKFALLYMQNLLPNYQLIQKLQQFQKMAEQSGEQLTQYEKFRLLKLANRKDDDNLSAHFSNFSNNISFVAKSERQININSFRSSRQNQQDFSYFKNEINSKNRQIHENSKLYSELEQKYYELLKNFRVKSEDAQRYKKLYEDQLNREKETKQKLKNWVKQAKNNLNN